MAVIITTSETHFTRETHRADFETCPHCRHRTALETWEKKPTLFCVGMVWGKTDSGAMMLECPNCMSGSWTHYPLTMRSQFRDFPAKIRAAAEKEFNRRKAEATTVWDASLCKRCPKLKRGPEDQAMSAYRGCEIGVGPARQECAAFPGT